jgi:dTDP-4-dehydrorhamnose 3,5-epimerase
MAFEFKELDLKGAYIIKDFFAGDNRGGFTKTFEKDIFGDAGISFSLNETFISRSAQNVIRGLHFQKNHPQAKLVSVISGAAWDVIVDLRIESPTFKEWRAQILSAENHMSFYVPRGFAHGFASLQDDTLMLYQCDGKYDSETDSGIIYNDKDIGIEWPIDDKIAIHSERDLKLELLEEYLKNPMKY